ncbi:ornithine decarboxylase, partial [Streptomyces sp. TRM76130]|nr:ornithine decarboxylase [Streptomyces sp. TRM76130]
AAEVRAAIEEIDHMQVNDRTDFCGPGLADGFDPLPAVIDLDGLGISGYQAADRLRERHGVIAHLSDHRRIGAQIAHGDVPGTTGELLAALKGLSQAAQELPEAPRVAVPSPARLRTDQVRLPRNAFFGPIEDVFVERAAARTAEMITPYPPG